MFDYSPIDNSALYTPVRIEENGKRFYSSDIGKFPSVTTVLSVMDGDWVEEWKARVGEDRANAVSNKAKSVGTSVHLMCEHYLKNEVTVLKRLRLKSMPEAKLRFDNFKVFLDDISTVFLSEAAVASSVFEIGGTVDCFAVYRGKLSVIDFKTASRPKVKEDILSYFAQGAFYSAAIKEQYGLNKYPRVVIAIAVNGLKEPQVFESEAVIHFPYLVEAIKKYKSEN